MNEPPQPKDDLKIKIGAREFQTNKNAMLDLFEEAKIQSKSRPTQTDKGKVAEAALRNWLTQFLPKKYAVTSGYIISQGDILENKLLHYDVIVYDSLNAPVLWVEKNADNSEQGKVRAIPAEYVHCVLEVKSTFNSKSCKEAKQKLWELDTLLAHVDDPDEMYKQYLPVNFCMGVVFFEIQNSEKTNFNALEKLIPLKTYHDLRGYFGGIILKAEGLNRDNSGRIFFGIGDNKVDIVGDLMNMVMVGNIKTPEGKYFSAILNWSPVNFSVFAFDLIALMNGTFRNGFVSSFHGMPFPVKNSK